MITYADQLALSKTERLILIRRGLMLFTHEGEVHWTGGKGYCKKGRLGDPPLTPKPPRGRRIPHGDADPSPAQGAAEV